MKRQDTKREMIKRALMQQLMSMVVQKTFTNQQARDTLQRFELSLVEWDIRQ